MADFLARGEVLLALRKDRHESQEHVAREINVSTKTVREWEKGHGIHWPNAETIAAYYDVQPDAIAVRKDRVDEQIQHAINSAADPYATQLDEINRKLDELPHWVKDDESGEAEDVPDSFQPEQDHPQDAQDEDEHGSA